MPKVDRLQICKTKGARTLLFLVFTIASLSTVNAQIIEVGGAAGKVISQDSYIAQLLHRASARSFQLGYVFQTLPSQQSAYAADFGYPTFTIGLLVADFSDVRLLHPQRTNTAMSRMGVSLTPYLGFRRSFFRTRSGWGADYSFHNGIGFSTHTFDWDTNADNELIGSPLSIYFAFSLQANYQNGRMQAFVGPEFRHLSNGALGHPNKGVNKVGVSAGVRYFLHPIDMGDTVRHRCRFVDKYFYTNISYHTALKTSVGEWTLNHKASLDGRSLPYEHFALYVAHGVSADVMYRYARRYASGIGFDAYYEPYIREAATNKGPIPSDMSRWSLGVSAKHEVFYERCSLQFSIGYYLNRPFAMYAIAGEDDVYERVGLRYTLPICNDCIKIGYNIHAHLAKAYASEIVLDFNIPW